MAVSPRTTEIVGRSTKHDYSLLDMFVSIRREQSVSDTDESLRCRRTSS